jgi:hypothetical protein
MNMVLEVNAILADPFHGCGLDENEDYVCRALLEGRSVPQVAQDIGFTPPGTYKVLVRALKKIAEKAGKDIAKGDLTTFVLDRIREAVDNGVE